MHPSKRQLHFHDKMLTVDPDQERCQHGSIDTICYQEQTIRIAHWIKRTSNLQALSKDITFTKICSLMLV